MHRPSAQLTTPVDQVPELWEGRKPARLAFYEELVHEGGAEVELAARIWCLTAPTYLRGEARMLYLAGKVAEAEFPIVVPIAVLIA